MRFALIALSLIFIAPSASFAKDDPVVHSAVPDYANATLFIAGSNFGSSPSVTIDTVPVTIIASSDSLLLVQVPASVLVTPGSYFVSVSNSKEHSGTFVVTFGTAGPKGDKGDKGETGERGVQGLQGEPGIIAAFRCPPSQFVVGIDTSGAGICASVSPSMPPPGPPTSVLDQSFIGSLNSNGTLHADSQFAQTFPVGKTGMLTAVEIAIGKETNPPSAGDLIVSILPTISGVPALASQTSPLTSIVVPASFWAFRDSGDDPSFYRRVELPPIPVTTGTVLAISVRRANTDDPADVFYWYGHGNETYTAGQAFARAGTEGWGPYQGFDFTFRTYVAPAP